MTSNAGEPDRSGACIAGRYRLEALIAEGGMGRVYRARNEMLGRAVAVKILLARHAQQPELVARFVREAQTANRVRHPNVVDVLDVGVEPGGTAYMVQELLHGQDLADHLRDRGGRVGEARALALMEPVVDAVAYAHRRGVVHRDLKPENVFLVREGERIVPKVLDFGISRCVTPEREAGDSMLGLAVGTPAYMPPEQARGEAVDARADVWSLGVILYQLVAGALPFAAGNDDAMLALVCFGEPTALENTAPDASPDVCRIVGHCLRRHPASRYSSATELLEDLRAAMRARGIAVAPNAAASVPTLTEPGPAPPELEWGDAREAPRVSQPVSTDHAQPARGRRLLALSAPALVAVALGAWVYVRAAGSDGANPRRDAVAAAAAAPGEPASEARAAQHATNDTAAPAHAKPAQELAVVPNTHRPPPAPEPVALRPVVHTVRRRAARRHEPSAASSATGVASNGAYPAIPEFPE